MSFNKQFYEFANQKQGAGGVPNWAGSTQNQNFLGMQSQIAPAAVQSGPMNWGTQQKAIANFLGLNGQVSPLEGPTVGIGSPIGGVDIPPADMNDPFGGRANELLREGYDANQIRAQLLGDQFRDIFSGQGFNTFGFSPPGGLPGSWQGPTQIPTFFDSYGYPYAVPSGGWNTAGYLPPGQEQPMGPLAYGHGGTN